MVISWLLRDAELEADALRSIMTVLRSSARRVRRRNTQKGSCLSRVAVVRGVGYGVCWVVLLMSHAFRHLLPCFRYYQLVVTNHARIKEGAKELV